MNVFEIIVELEKKERQIEEKLHKITIANLNPFPWIEYRKLNYCLSLYMNLRSMLGQMILILLN